jgi:beta-barrel assembly-enhancing protease
MKFACPSAYFAALGLVVCFASAPAFALFAAEGNEAENVRVETRRANLLLLNEERVVGQRLAYLYAQLHPPLKDVSAQLRLNRVAAQLRAVTNAPTLDIKLVKSARPEAVSFPSGHIFITSALLRLTRNDDELAAVIAHEAAHVAHRHLARLIELALTLSPGERDQFPTRAAIITGQVSQFVFPAALDAARLRYEMEADQLAVLWLECAGYRVTALPLLLDRLNARLSPQAQQERSALRARIALLVSPHNP